MAGQFNFDEPPGWMENLRVDSDERRRLNARMRYYTQRAAVIDNSGSVRVRSFDGGPEADQQNTCDCEQDLPAGTSRRENSPILHTSSVT